MQRNRVVAVRNAILVIAALLAVKLILQAPYIDYMG